MRNRPACPFFPIVDLKSRLRSRAHGREQIRVTRSKTALCVTFTVISPRKRSSFPFAYSLYFDTCTYLSESSLVHDLPDFRGSIERGKEISFLRPFGGESVIEAFRPIRGFYYCRSVIEQLWSIVNEAFWKNWWSVITSFLQSRVKTCVLQPRSKKEIGSRKVRHSVVRVIRYFYSLLFSGLGITRGHFERFVLNESGCVRRFVSWAPRRKRFLFVLLLCFFFSRSRFVGRRN